MSAETEYTPGQLRRMDEDEARQTLTVEQYERWEKIQDLAAEADDTREQWQAEDEQIADLVVHADMEDLGTRLDLFGNDVLVHIDPEDETFRAVAEALDEEFGDKSHEELTDLDAETTDRIADALEQMLDIVLVEWNGNEWGELRQDERDFVLGQARSEWGIDGLLLGWLDIAAAVNEDRESKLSVVESFRRPERRGDR